MQNLAGKADIKTTATRLFHQAKSLLTEIDDFDQALAMGNWIAHHLWKNPCGIYRDDEIESILFDKFPLSKTAADSINGSGELHLATTVYVGGGHTRLMKHYMAIRSAKQPLSILITNPPQKHAALAFSDSYNKLLIDATNSESRIAQTAQHLASHARAFLYIKPDDLETAIAIKYAKKLNPALSVIFVNHADHVFSVGLSEVNSVVEISGYGWSLRKLKHLEGTSCFVGIPLSGFDINNQPQDWALTAGASYKFKPDRKHSLPRLLAQVLDFNPSFKLKVIGAKRSDYWWWPMRIWYRQRVTFITSIPFDQYLTLLSQSRIYIDSFPVTGGTALPEALLAGKSVIGISSGMSGYSPADQLKVSQEQFVEKCSALYNADLEPPEQKATREACRWFHKTSEISRRLKAATEPHAIKPTVPEFAEQPQIMVFEASWSRRGQFLLGHRAWKKLPKPLKIKLFSILCKNLSWRRLLAYRLQMLLA